MILEKYHRALDGFEAMLDSVAGELWQWPSPVPAGGPSIGRLGPIALPDGPGRAMGPNSAMPDLGRPLRTPDQ
jgi:hypothetical protein